MQMTFMISQHMKKEIKNLKFSAETFIKENLKVNITKIEHTRIEKGDNKMEVEKKKKLGSLLGYKEDIECRKQLAIASMNKYQKCT